jgi:hypothetical protein
MSGSGSTLTTAATTGATANGWTSANGTITVNNPPKSGTQQTNKAVEVILTENMPRYFTALFSSSTVTIQARSASTTQGEHDACVIALGPTGTDITMSGGANVSSPKCDIVSDSDNSSGISMSGGASVTTPCLVSVRGVSVKAAQVARSIAAPPRPPTPRWRPIPVPAFPNRPSRDHVSRIRTRQRFCPGIIAAAWQSAVANSRVSAWHLLHQRQSQFFGGLDGERHRRDILYC